MNGKPYEINEIIIGEYRVLDVFGGEGKSGMGIVYLVESREFPFPIVLKTFQKNTNIQTDRFRGEAKAWVSIGIHPNIVQAFFVKDINEQLFIAAEYIAPDETGRNTVTDYIEQGGVSDINAIRWTAQFCYAMEFAISKGLKAHRDIKPDNLMVDQFGNLKVTDFGLAKAFNVDFKTANDSQIENPKLTSEGAFLGTLQYASPEQILNASAVDFRSDIYSFGIVLYELISSGSFPYSLASKVTLNDIAMMHFTEALRPIKHPLFPIIEKCLSKVPDERYQTYNDLLDDLEIIAERLNIKLPSKHIQSDATLRELYIQSLSHLELGEELKALTLIEEYLKFDTLDSSAWSLKGRILNLLNRNDEAITATLESYKFDPNNSHTLNNLGLFFIKKGEQEKGIDFLMKAVRADLYNIGAQMNLAIHLSEAGLHKPAVETILRALDQAPDKKTLQFNASNIAAFAMQNGAAEQAVPVLRRLVLLDDSNTNNWFNLGICYQSLNQKVDALKCYEKVLLTNPLDKQALIFSAQLNAELGEYDVALNICEMMLDKQIAPLQAISFKAQILQGKNEGWEAVKFVKQVISSGNQNNDYLWTLLGNIYEKEEMYAVAKSCFMQAKNILLSTENPNQENILFLDGKIGKMDFFENHTPKEIMEMLSKNKD